MGRGQDTSSGSDSDEYRWPHQDGYLQTRSSRREYREERRFSRWAASLVESHSETSDNLWEANNVWYDAKQEELEQFAEEVDMNLVVSEPKWQSMVQYIKEAVEKWSIRFCMPWAPARMARAIQATIRYLYTYGPQQPSDLALLVGQAQVNAIVHGDVDPLLYVTKGNNNPYDQDGLDMMKVMVCAVLQSRHMHGQWSAASIDAAVAQDQPAASPKSQALIPGPSSAPSVGCKVRGRKHSTGTYKARNVLRRRDRDPMLQHIDEHPACRDCRKFSNAVRDYHSLYMAAGLLCPRQVDCCSVSAVEAASEQCALYIGESTTDRHIRHRMVAVQRYISLLTVLGVNPWFPSIRMVARYVVDQSRVSQEYGQDAWVAMKEMHCVFGGQHYDKKEVLQLIKEQEASSLLYGWLNKCIKEDEVYKRILEGLALQITMAHTQPLRCYAGATLVAALARITWHHVSTMQYIKLSSSGMSAVNRNGKGALVQWRFRHQTVRGVNVIQEWVAQLKAAGLPGRKFLLYGANLGCSMWCARQASYHDADRALRTLLQSPLISLSKHEAAKWSWHSIVQNAIDATRDLPPVRAGINEVDDWSEDPTDLVPETAEIAPFRKKRRVKMPCGKEWSPGTRPAHVLDVANATEHLNDGANLSMCRRFCTGTAFRPSAGASFVDAGRTTTRKCQHCALMMYNLR